MFFVFNICEGLLWIVIGVGFAVVYSRKREHPGPMLSGCVLFLTFGVSDFVETTTGAWYKPWWMLLWKAANLLGLLVVYRLLRIRTATKIGNSPEVDNAGSSQHSEPSEGSR